MSKICPVCGEAQEAGVARCQNCGASLEEERREPTCNLAEAAGKNGRVPCQKPILRLYALIQKKEILIEEDGVIGRRGSIDQSFFAGDRFISEKHCSLSFEDGDWKVEHLSSSNPTVLNGMELSHNFAYPLREGDRLELSDLIFKVSMVMPREENPADAAIEGRAEIGGYINSHLQEEETVPVWIISCPVCGTSYQVESQGVRMRYCEVCDDDFDRKEIASERPTRKTGISGRIPLSENLVTGG